MQVRWGGERKRERAPRYRRSPCKETELVGDYCAAGSEGGGTQGEVYLPICARTHTPSYNWVLGLVPDRELLFFLGALRTFLSGSRRLSFLLHPQTSFCRLQAAW